MAQRSCTSSRVENDDHSQLPIVWDLGLRPLATAHLPVAGSPDDAQELALLSSAGILLRKYFYYLKKGKYVFVLLKATKAGSWLGFSFRASLYPSLI